MARKAIEIDPGYEDAFYNLSLAQHRQEDFNNAIKNADVCLNRPNHDKCMLLGSGSLKIYAIGRV